MTKLGQRVSVNRGDRKRERERESERERSTLQEFHFDASSPTRLVSQRIFIQGAIKLLPRSQSRTIERSKSDGLYLAEERNFILSWNSLTACAFFSGVATKSGLFWLPRRIPREIFLPANSIRRKYKGTLSRPYSIERGSTDRCWPRRRNFKFPPLTYARPLFRL